MGVQKILNIFAKLFLIQAVVGWDWLPEFDPDTTKLRDAAQNMVDIPFEGRMRFCPLARAHDLSCKEHEVTTLDGYILSLFHMQGSDSLPVLLVPGFLHSSISFVARGAGSLAYALSKAFGFDVWIANLRGNFYSRRHQDLDPDTDKEYWDFSFDEFGRYDLPAIIDYVLAHTGHKKLLVIAHGEGATSLFVTSITRPEYNKKVQLLIAMSPLVAPGVTSSSVSSLAPLLRLFLTNMHKDELLGNDSLVAMLRALCSYPIENPKLCRTFVSFLSGWDEQEIDDDFLRLLIGHYPAGSSKKNALHLLQMFETSRFAHYDYGSYGNMHAYNSSTSPEYDLRKVGMNVAFLVAPNDRLVTPTMMDEMKYQLPRVVDYYTLLHENASHADFLWGKDIYLFMDVRIHKLLQMFSN